MKKNHHILGAKKSEVHLQHFSKSLDEGRMWLYNILGDNEGNVYILSYLPIFLYYIYPELINNEPNVQFFSCRQV